MKKLTTAAAKKLQKSPSVTHQRLRMEGWRQRRLGPRNNVVQRNTKTDLTQTGLLMEGVCTTLRFSFAQSRVN